jgi:putative Holliday junction resolvase
VAQTQPPRLLGLDPGDRRIGVAISDELGLTAQPLLTLRRTNRRNDLRSLARIVRRYGCSAIVVGFPLHMSGAPGPRALAAKDFASALQSELGVPVHLWDERLSTAEAHRHLDAVARPSSTRKTVIDQVAAVLILQSYMDAHRGLQ